MAGEATDWSRMAGNVGKTGTDPESLGLVSHEAFVICRLAGFVGWSTIAALTPAPSGSRHRPPDDTLMRRDRQWLELPKALSLIR